MQRATQTSARKAALNWMPQEQDSRNFGSASEGDINLVKFVPAIAYHLCLVLPEGITQPGARFLADLCTVAM